MAAKDSENNQWTDPKDYGLPFVEITPLRAKTNFNKKESTSTFVTPVVEQELIVLIPVVPEVEIETIPSKKASEINTNQVEEFTEIAANQVEKSADTKKESKVQKPVSHKVKEDKKTASWVWAVFILAFGIISFIIWQLQFHDSSPTNVSKVEVAENATEAASQPIQEIVYESTASDQNQSIVNQDSITSINNSNPNISKPAQTGTTIANIASGNLIRIESKAERPQYFIIVGSLPNEKLAIEEASQYFERSPEIYLISPEEGSRNYRLGLSKFGSFKPAADELARIKSQYTEELWILKY